MFYFLVETLTRRNNRKSFSTLNPEKRLFLNGFGINIYGQSLPGLFILLSLMMTARAINGATYTVDTLADDEANGCQIGQCTLREAVNEANLAAGADLINFAGGLTGTITLTGGQLTITGDLTVNGPGARNLTVSGNHASRVILIATPLTGGDFTVNLSGLTITGGNATPVLIGSTLIGDGGGILNGALLGVLTGTSTLNLSDSAVTGNSSTTLGGGVATRLGAITSISRSLIAGNQVNPVIAVDDGTVGGGGISNAALSVTTVSNSTITENNSLAVGGGVLNAAGTVNLTNDTVSHNTSVLAGGGAVSLLGTIPPILGVTNLRNTIIAKNNDLLATDILGRDVVGVLGSFNSLGNNLIGSNFGAEANFAASIFTGISPQPNAQADLVGGIEAGNQIIDPLLGALANNGGTTDSRAIIVGSPALNQGNSCVTANTCAAGPGGANSQSALTTDQRGAGFARLSGAAVDIGAYEYQFITTAAAVSISGRVLSQGKGFAVARVQLTGTGGASRSVMTNSFGSFTFEEVESGATYIINVSAKGRTFAPQIVSVTDNVTGLILTAQ